MNVRGLLVTALAVSPGCIGPAETQFLSLNARPLNVEARSYDYHDPFPDEMAGPDTVTRPRAFEDPRSDTRKLLDIRSLYAAHPAAARPQYVRGGRTPAPAYASSPLPNYPYPNAPGTPLPPTVGVNVAPAAMGPAVAGAPIIIPAY